MQPKADYILRGPPITQRRYINSRIPNLKIKWLSACAARSKAMMMVRWSNIFTVRYSTPPGQLAVKIWRVSKTAKRIKPYLEHADEEVCSEQIKPQCTEHR
jgi:hypothetical protein